jgi:hypothetical protein
MADMLLRRASSAGYSRQISNVHSFLKGCQPNFWKRRAQMGDGRWGNWQHCVGHWRCHRRQMLLFVAFYVAGMLPTKPLRLNIVTNVADLKANKTL